MLVPYREIRFASAVQQICIQGPVAEVLTSSLLTLRWSTLPSNRDAKAYSRPSCDPSLPSMAFYAVQGLQGPGGHMGNHTTTTLYTWNLALQNGKSLSVASNVKVPSGHPKRDRVAVPPPGWQRISLGRLFRVVCAVHASHPAAVDGQRLQARARHAATELQPTHQLLLLLSRLIDWLSQSRRRGQLETESSNTAALPQPVCGAGDKRQRHKLAETGHGGRVLRSSCGRGLRAGWSLRRADADGTSCSAPSVHVHTSSRRPLPGSGTPHRIPLCMLPTRYPSTSPSSPS